MFRRYTSLASLQNKTFWTGNQQYLDNPLTSGNIVSFGVKSSDGRFGVSSFNLIKLFNQRVWSSGKNYWFSMGTETPNNGYDSKQVFIGFLKG